MLRKILFLIVLLGLAYIVYRFVDPAWASRVVHTIQNMFGVTQEIVVDEPVISTWFEEDTSAYTDDIVYTWSIDSMTVVELDYILSGSGTSSQVTSSSTMTSAVVIPSPSWSSSASSSSSSAWSQWLSRQDMADLEKLLQAIVE